MNSLLLDSRTEGEPSLATQIHDCTRELMEATNTIELRAKDSVDKIKALVDANSAKVDAAKKSVNEKRKREVDVGIAALNEEGSSLETRTSDLQTLKTQSEAIRVDLRQSDRLKADLAEEVVDLAATRDSENKICHKKKLVVDDYVDTAEKAVSLFQTHMGFAMSQNSNGDLDLTFTRLDPRSPSRPFTLVLHLHSNSKLYSFVSSSPELDFQSHVNALNRTNDLKKFIGRVRKTFIGNMKR